MLTILCCYNVTAIKTVTNTINGVVTSHLEKIEHENDRLPSATRAVLTNYTMLKTRT